MEFRHTLEAAFMRQGLVLVVAIAHSIQEVRLP